ncbi:AraC family transcriptional regulator [Rhodovarius crocodyli]|nr:AraC family transcriptional regulator [Rhodovarius crocodyli]
MAFSLGDADWAATDARGGDYAMDWHTHDCAMLLLPRTGVMRVALEGIGRTEHDLRPGEGLIVTAGVGHRTRAGSRDHRHLAFYLSRARLAAWLPRGADWRSGPLPGPLLPLLAYRDGLAAGEERAGLTDRLIVAEFLSHAMPPLARDHGAALVRAVAAHLSADPAARHDLDGLAARFGVSRRHLTRLFRRHAGEGISDFLQRLRVNAAAGRLAAGAGVLEAAGAVGVASPSHLARMFRRQTGHAPGKARSG